MDASLNARAKRGLSQQAVAAAERNLVSDERFKQVVAVDPTRNLAAASQRFEPIRIATAPSAPRPLSTTVQSVAAVFAGGGHGTGFVISNDGYLLTNHHVVGGPRYVKVRWPDGFEALGEVIRTDRRRDVALIKTAGKTAPLALRSTPAALGEAVFAIGALLDEKSQNTVTKGIVSANRTFDGQAFIQSDVGINPGNSGGPLLDEKGFVVGLSVSRYQVNDAPTGLNLFIPIADALDALALKPAT
ncbi:S1C family serine protease [Phenylobacterium sp.]|uniref:S1C family serine protease n=1 Tax=Phenylobacterium sp. TaxID=1871053 RepID=UPI003919365C